MLDLIDTITTAISRVTAIAGWRVIWRGEKGQSLQDAAITFPVLIVNINNDVSVNVVASDGLMRVGYGVQISGKFIPTATDSTLREKELRTMDANLRAIMRNIGYLDSEGLTNMEIDESSLSQTSENNSSTGVCESIVNFTVNFDEE